MAASTRSSLPRFPNSSFSLLTFFFEIAHSVDYFPFLGNFGGVTVTQNTFSASPSRQSAAYVELTLPLPRLADAKSHMIKVGIAAGPSTWGSSAAALKTYGGSFSGNTFTSCVFPSSLPLFLLFLTPRFLVAVAAPATLATASASQVTKLLRSLATTSSTPTLVAFSVARASSFPSFFPDSQRD